MASCTPAIIESTKYCDDEEALSGGLRDNGSVFMPDDVQTYPVYTTTNGQNDTVSDSEALITAASGFVMKTGKKPFQMQCILNKNSLSVNSKGIGFVTELKVRIQDNTHNRGICNNFIKSRFSFAFQEDSGRVRLMGQSDGISSGYLASVKKGSYKEEIQEALDGERYIEFIIAADRYQPVDYNFPIVY